MTHHILFDLDCTIYSIRLGLEDRVVERMVQFLADFLGMSVEEAREARKNLAGRFGTTLEWIMAEKGFTDVEYYLRKVHPEDEADALHPVPGLREFIESLPCPCSILTNSPRFHADRIIKKMELEGAFTRVFDIKDNNFRGKPHASAFQKTLDALGLKPEDTLFIDDYPRYVEGFLGMGGRGLLLDEMDAHPEYPHERIKDLRELTRFI